jgi:hypothetical protein
MWPFLAQVELQILAVAVAVVLTIIAHRTNGLAAVMADQE